MKTQEIRDLVRVVEESDIDELEVSRWGHRIRITKRKNNTATAQPQQIAVPAQPHQQAANPTPQESPTTTSDNGKSTEAAPAPEEATVDTSNWNEVKSPIVGTFYRAPSPESDPYIDVGDSVKPGQTLCIIEAMKIMNEIEAEAGGVLKEILVENSQPVEYNQTLFLIEPK